MSREDIILRAQEELEDEIERETVDRGVEVG